MPGDTLVLRIEEYTDDDNLIMIRVFVFYDTEKSRYALRGNRYYYDELGDLTSECPFSYYCKRRFHAFDFIRQIFVDYDSLTFALLNYADLPLSSDSIQYPVLNEQSDRTNEIVCFDNGREDETTAYNSIYKHLELIKVMYNEWQ
jgi:hypothetical protein